jgi:hypothetical protein
MTDNGYLEKLLKKNELKKKRKDIGFKFDLFLLTNFDEN